MKVITIGRSKENNNIIVNDEKVSRNHLQIIQDDQGRCSVMDLGSTNGTFVNGQRISGEAPLHKGDELRIGSQVLPWESYLSAKVVPPDSSPTPPPSLSPIGDRIESPRSKWWLWVIIGVVALMIIGGITLWLCSRPTKVQVPSTPSISLDSLRAEANAEEAEYQKELRVKAELKAKQDSLDKVNISKLSDEEKKAHKKEKEDLEKRIAQNDNKMVELTKNLNSLNGQISTLNTQLQQAKERENSANERANKAETDLKNKDKALELISDMQTILNGWDDSKAVAFCKKKGWPTKNARTVIYNHFSNLSDNNKKQKMIDEMKVFKVNPKQTEQQTPTSSKATASTTPPAQSASTESQPDTNKSKK